MDYNQDINEIVASITESELEEGGDYKHCLGQITIRTGEEYLDGRAKYIESQIDTHAGLKRALTQLSSLCGANGRSCNLCPISKYCNKYITELREKVKNSPRIVDLFCGSGGLSLGFVQEGFSVSLANDIEDCCIETYAHNHPEIPRSRIIKGNIQTISSQIISLLDRESIDVVVGGPPCQGFSMANRQRLIDDPRNHLYRSYVHVVSSLLPKFFVMENVKGMLGVAPQVLDDFKAIGYEVSYHVLNAKDFGVPQNRERLIYIGNRLGIDNEEIFAKIFDRSRDIPFYTLNDALEGLRELQASRVKNTHGMGSQESGFIIEKNVYKISNEYIRLINNGMQPRLVYNHKARFNNDRDIEIYRRMNPGDRSDDPKIADIMPYARRNRIFKDKYFKLEGNKVCKTITAHMKYDCNMYIHPYQARGLTPREAARIQSYPDDYFFRGAYTKTFMQIGNSVPPLLGRAIAFVLKQYLS